MKNLKVSCHLSRLDHLKNKHLSSDEISSKRRLNYNCQLLRDFTSFVASVYSLLTTLFTFLMSHEMNRTQYNFTFDHSYKIEIRYYAWSNTGTSSRRTLDKEALAIFKNFFIRMNMPKQRKYAHYQFICEISAHYLYNSSTGCLLATLQTLLQSLKQNLKKLAQVCKFSCKF